MAIINGRGAEGERMAQEFLIKQGMIIRETNWRIGPRMGISRMKRKPNFMIRNCGFLANLV
ncbi:MAG: hypothetical protein J5523_06600 [Muribaculaceae bacterium]|nr:hypothetical protein [Muribaculaceae bacterium]